VERIDISTTVKIHRSRLWEAQKASCWGMRTSAKVNNPWRSCTAFFFSLHPLKRANVSLRHWNFWFRTGITKEWHIPSKGQELVFVSCGAWLKLRILKFFWGPGCSVRPELWTSYARVSESHDSDQIWSNPNLLFQKQCCVNDSKHSQQTSGSLLVLEKRKPICIKPKLIMVDVKVRNCQCNCPSRWESLGWHAVVQFLFMNSIYLQGFQETLFSLEYLVSHFSFCQDQPSSLSLIS